VLPEQHQPIGPNTEAAVTPASDGGLVKLFVEVSDPVVQEDEIVSGAVVFVEGHGLVGSSLVRLGVASIARRTVLEVAKSCIENHLSRIENPSGEQA